MPRFFPVCPSARGGQIDGVPRLSPVLALAFAAALPLRAADADLARFGTVTIRPSTAYLVIAAVTMTMPPFARHDGVYTSSYFAKVFPYFYFNEKGRIWITGPDDALRLVARGKPIDFKGRAVSDGGDPRRVEGHVTPTGRLRGNIEVRVFISRRLYLTYDTTYELTDAPTSVTAR
jgi:hypothetical protein